MALASGTSVGSFEIVALIGSGGMGEVYRARDIRLQRDVAIKVLPSAFTSDPSRLERLEREARLLATLNHPNIASIYGLEETASMRALVLELIEGPTLADRLLQGGVTRDDALRMALQIAQALEAAHHKGVVHRDLKPSNIKLTSDGLIKVLDFGLAKAFSPSSDDLLTGAAGPTQTGAIIGTPAYMSPEQARGQAAGFQSDIWSFGVVLYELMTGISPFQRNNTAETLARVLDAQPDYTILPPGTPAIARRLIRRCVEKDPRRRQQHIGDVRLELEEALGSDAQSHEPSDTSAARRRWSMIAIAVAGVIVAALGGWLIGGRRASEQTGRTLHATIAFPEAANSQPFGTRQIAISSDGNLVAFAAPTRVWIRRMDQAAATAVPAVGDDPFFSPDGEWIGMFMATGVYKIPVRGGKPTLIASTSNRAAGAAWRSDGTIVFATTEGVYEVSANGGEPRLLVKPDRARQESVLAWPEFLPDGQSLLLTLIPADARNAPDIVLLDLRTLVRQVVVKGGTAARYVPSGHLVFVAGASLRAVAFDPVTRQARGEPVAIPTIETAATVDNGAANFAVSQSGTLVYGNLARPPFLRRLVWIDHRGKEEPLAFEPAGYNYPRVSPDGSRVATELTTNGNRDIWLLDLKRLTRTQVTDGPTEDLLPVWSPDGQRIWFGSNRTGDFDVYSQAADGATTAKLELASPGFQAAQAFTPDGRQLTVSDKFSDVGVLDLDHPDRLKPLLNTSFDERLGQVSPDGQWVAYESDESGTQFEIMLRSFPNVAQHREKISINGGRYPHWGPKGSNELYYVGLDGGMMAASVTLSPALKLGPVTKLFDSVKPPANRSGLPYDVSMIDGRFLTFKDVDATRDGPTSVSIVVNWLTEISRIVPNR